MNAGKQWQWRLAIAAWALTLPAAASQQVPSQPTAASLARDEGVLRLIIERCFVDEPRQLEVLQASSGRFLRALSSSSGIPLTDLERLAADSLLQARKERQISKDQCATNRDRTLKAMRERDAALRMQGWWP